MRRRPLLPLQVGIRIGEIIFNEGDFAKAAKLVDATIPGGIKKSVASLSEGFDVSTARAEHELFFPPPRELNAYLSDLTQSARRLAGLLELDCEPDSLIQLGRSDPPVRPHPTPQRLFDTQKGVDWLLVGARVGAKLRIEPTEEVDIPNDLRPLLTIARELVGPEKLNRRIRILQSHKIIAKGRPSDDLVGQLAIELSLASAPLFLAMVIGLSERASKIVKRASAKTNYERTFADEMFAGLVLTHRLAFGHKPKLRTSDREPRGTGVKWARTVLRLAVARIPQVPSDIQSDERFARAKRGLIRVARYSDATIADRMRNA